MELGLFRLTFVARFDAGSAAQALAVLIADMIRRALKLEKYEPSAPK